MSTFYPQAMSAQLPLPLTPPYPYGSIYDDRSCSASRYPHDSYMPPRLDSARGQRQSRYAPPHSAQLGAFAPPSFGTQGLPPPMRYNEPMGAPVLPPLRLQDPFTNGNYYNGYQQPASNQVAAQQPQQQQEPVPKEEQATGGVSATLDYEMEMMTDFVAEKAQGMYALVQSNICLADIDINRSIQPGLSVHPSFRKWVAQVLAATRLPSATIMLSLGYLTTRMSSFPKTVDGSDRQLYRLLTVSMILGSKFLDDNTFINRSWSDVTGIKVVELNTLEREWLSMIGFNLHTDPTADGVTQWIATWKDYELRMGNIKRLAKLSPISTDLPRSSPLNAAHPPFQPGQSKSVHGNFTPRLTGSMSSAGTPYASADPWNRPERSQPEYYQTQSRLAHFDGLDHARRYDPAPRHQYPQFQLPPLHTLAPSFYTPWNHAPATLERPHGYGCLCFSCTRQATYNHFTPQTVVG